MRILVWNGKKKDRGDDEDEKCNEKRKYAGIGFCTAFFTLGNVGALRCKWNRDRSNRRID